MQEAETAPDSVEPSVESAEEEVPFETVDSSRLLQAPDALTAQEANGLLAERPGRVVVWAGDSDTGKTTLSCELYERMRRGETALKFAGSRTLLALEQRSHPSRAISGRRVRETHRTERDPDDRELLHIRAQDSKHGLLNLILADLPGETFRELRDHVTVPDDVSVLRRADKLAFLADGARIVDPKQRSMVQTGIRQLVQRLTAAGLPDRRTAIALVVTMWDLVVDDPVGSAYWEEREDALLSELREIDPEVGHFRVSARPPPDWTHETNMESLTRWVVAPPPVVRDPRLPSPRPIPRIRQPKALRRAS